MSKYLELLIRIPIREQAQNINELSIVDAISLSYNYDEPGQILLMADDDIFIDMLAHIVKAQVVKNIMGDR